MRRMTPKNARKHKIVKPQQKPSAAAPVAPSPPIPPDPLPYWKKPLFIMTAAIFIFFFPLFFFHFTLIPVHTGDVVAGIASEPSDYHSIDPFGTLGELSYAEFTKNNLKAGRLPFWSPFQSLGHPFLANIVMSAIFAPVNVFRFLLPSSQWGLIGVLNLLIGAFSVYALCRTYDLTRRAAAIGGVSYLALGTTGLFLVVPSVMSVAVWGPCLILGIESLIGKRAVSLRRGGLLLILGAYGVITGGHITITLLTIVVAALYTVARAVQARPAATQFGTMAAAILIALLLTAVQWIPFVEYVTYRGNTYEDYSEVGAFKVSDAPAFFFPYFYGRLHNLYTDTKPALAIGEGAWSIGWLPPALLPFVVAAVVGLFWRRQFRTGPFALFLASVPVWLWAFRAPPFHLASYLPFMNRARGQYVSIVLGFTLCVLIAFGFDCLEERRIRLRTIVLSTVGLLIALALWGELSFLAHGVSVAGAAQYLFSHLSYSGVWAILAMGSVWLAMSRPRTQQALFLIGIGLALFSAVGFFPWASAGAEAHAHLGAAVGFVLLSAAVCFLPFTAIALCVAMGAAAGTRLWVMVAPHHLPHQHDLFAPRPYITFLQQHAGPEYRAYGMDGYLFPNWSSAYGISSPNALTPMVTLQVERFCLTFLDAYQPPLHFWGLDRSDRGKSPSAELLRNKRFWDYLGVRYIVANDSHALAHRTTVWVYRNGTWFSQTASGSGRTNESRIADFGAPGDLPVVGDWNGDGRLKVGVFRKGDWIVDWNGNNHWDATDAAHVLTFGAAGDLPVVGDWNGDGRLKLGVFRNGQWLIDWNGNNHLDAADAAHTFYFGAPGDLPVVGDWNGDGRMKIGVFRKGGWIVDWNGNYQWDSTDAAHTFSFGVPGDLPIMGDWNGDGRLKVGVFRQGDWSVDWNGNHVWDATDAAHIFPFGRPGDIPVVVQNSSATQGSLFTAAFQDSSAHATVWENQDAKIRAYVAPRIRVAKNWQDAQDQFSAQGDLRETAFVEERSSCASSESVPPPEPSRVFGMSLDANRVSMDVEAHSPGLLVVTDAYMPGWKAVVDGHPEPVIRVNGTFRGTCLNQTGRHRVVMSYQPPHWPMAVSLSGLGFLGLIAFAFVRRISGE